MELLLLENGINALSRAIVFRRENLLRVKSLIANTYNSLQFDDDIDSWILPDRHDHIRNQAAKAGNL